MSSSTRLHSTSLPGSMTHNDPLDGYNEDETYRDLPLAALPIAIDLEEDIIGILHYLPSDLVESIIDLVSDRETLKACTLVCRAWVPRSRKHLLDMSLVRMDRVKAESFIHLSTSPHFSLKRIPNLHLSFRGESSRMASQVVPILSHHQVWVESLTVVADTFSSGSCKESLGLISAMWKMSVTELEIQNYLCDNLRDVLPFVHSFGCLEAFRLTGTFRGRVSARKLPSRLKKFTFSNSHSHPYSRGTEEVLHWLTSPKDGVPPRLLELNLKGLGGSGGLSELRKLLEVPTSRALQDLTLSSITFTHDGHYFITLSPSKIQFYFLFLQISFQTFRTSTRFDGFLSHLVSPHRSRIPSISS
ncbi:hypothetical protein E1B28_003335 [Marasmius oreades]|uniref:F-box domain-containing protein n=1 Tax=Marasmius oreades TaxID=181124 RepID=A0A9P7RMD3_9AGAR|nr:uncharacterized protein E1B28_003335 [Marasmius oreades]KAG7085795.1 hypothetical protein E1B28_003335 [Marasmius oreades]